MADLYGRRKFISTITKTAGTTMIVTLPDISLAQELSQANAAFIVQQVINIILKEIPNPF